MIFWIHPPARSIWTTNDIPFEVRKQIKVTLEFVLDVIYSFSFLVLLCFVMFCFLGYVLLLFGWPFFYQKIASDFIFDRSRWSNAVVASFDFLFALFPYSICCNLNFLSILSRLFLLIDSLWFLTDSRLSSYDHLPRYCGLQLLLPR